MTLDEAIQRENKIAEENQKIVDTQIVFDDVSISELYCDDTEVIEEHLSNYRKCAEYHKQITDWLEELKSYIEIGTVEECRNSILDIQKAYNKAIDDFVAEIEKEYDNDYCPNVSDYLDYEISIRDLFKIAEQLKAGEQNKQSKQNT